MIQENHRPLDRLKLYRLVPVARAGDPNWDNADNHGEVIVRAFSAADARVTAAEAELDFTEIDAAPAEGNSTRDASAFRNERLYAVVEMLDQLGVAASGPRGVVDGVVSVGTIKPTQIS
ncbi:hypothetical protein ASE23_09520 [Rhizobium sp. Root73]|uniref:hypothetical protein n=1 Tax=unclassified Rhizobium TaxID=2613769 RepID=UPI0007144D94|nr:MULTISPECIES: hypothetical protein [unclassified Rhizobium]KQV29757.1 hypothetical protein ASC96_09960 [Rhizobium sp. Root1204]KQY05113.1 hypothetical protein ASD36_11745 [Rhizobium sp. Root1334]KRC01742.1 hypothetical protein ASE23_09520 [Rhizobium sp. Root73]